MTNTQAPVIMFSVGDPSADQHASQLIKELIHELPSLNTIGMGGAAMQAAGFAACVNSEKLAVVGFVEVIKRAFSLRRAFKQCVACLSVSKPDLLILMDYAAFNLRLAKVAKKHGIPVLYYIAPQVWASREYRVKTIKRVVDKLAVIYPFEKRFYQQRGVEAIYVGHPSAMCLEGKVDDSARDKTCIGLLPGSRSSEIKNGLPVMCEAARRLKAQRPDVSFKMVKAHSVSLSECQMVLQAYPDLNIEILEDLSSCMAHCHACIATSGTVTLQLTCYEIPYALIYRVNAITAWLAKRLINIPFIGIANIISQKPIIHEFIQERCRADLIAKEMLNLLEDEAYYQQVKGELKQVKQQLQSDHAEKTIKDLVLEML